MESAPQKEITRDIFTIEKNMWNNKST